MLVNEVKKVKIGNKFDIGGTERFTFIGGPCVIESEELVMEVAGKLKEITDKLGINFVFKSSFDKANRSSYHSFRGPGLEEGLRILKSIKKELDVPVVADLGSGSLVDLSQYGLPQEPMPQQLIAAGVSLVSFSGDKLLGGPQAGIIVGKKEMIARLQSHPLKRAIRADKMTLAALEATLRLYLHPEALAAKLPTLRQLTRSQEAVHAQAQHLQARLAEHYGDEFALIKR